MSETPFPSEAEEPAVDVVEDEQSGPDRRLLIGGGVAALALLAGGFLFLTGGGEEDDFAPIRRAPRAAAAAPAPTATPIRLAPVSQEQLGRDPFKPLYIEPAAPAPAPPAEAPAGGSVVPPQGQQPPAANPPAAKPAASTAPTKRAEYELVLRKVTGAGAEQVAEFSIGGQKHTAKVREVFGPSKNMLLLDLQQRAQDGKWVAVIRVGDSSPFDAVIDVPVFVPA